MAYEGGRGGSSRGGFGGGRGGKFVLRLMYTMLNLALILTYELGGRGGFGGDRGGRGGRGGFGGGRGGMLFDLTKCTC